MPAAQTNPLPALNDDGLVAAAVTPQPQTRTTDDLYRENEKLRASLASITRAKKVLSRALTDKVQGKMTMKRMEKLFGVERAASVKVGLTFITKAVWKNQKIFHNNWTEFNMANRRRLCWLIMQKVKILDDDVPEVFWRMCIVPCSVQCLNDIRNGYSKVAKGEFGGEFMQGFRCVFYDCP